MDEAPGDVVSGLIDLTEVDFAGLAGLDSAVLSNALQSIRDEVEHPEAAVAGFQSTI